MTPTIAIHADTRPAAREARRLAITHNRFAKATRRRAAAGQGHAPGVVGRAAARRATSWR